MGTRDGLEAALITTNWDRDTLAVYADHLQAQGDPRGELIALDLELASRSSPELVARRTSLMTGWLGRLVPSNPHTPWIGDSFRYGFVEDLVLQSEEDATGRLEQVLASPLAPYLKRVTLRGDSEHVTAMLRGLAERTHHWLSELAVRSWGASPVDADAVAGFVAAAPALATLEVHGHRVFETFAHPALRRLRITGHSALGSIFADETTVVRAPPLPGVDELDLALDQPYDAEHYTEPAPPPNFVLALPALRKLDLSRNEPEQRQRGYDEDLDENDYEVEDPPQSQSAIAVLRRQKIRAQLTHLKLPSLRSLEELELLEATVADMRQLVEVEITRAHYFKLPAKLATTTAKFIRPASWPWPRVDQIPHGDSLHVLVPGSRSGDTIAIADAAAVMEQRFEELDADARYAWTRFWVFVEQLGALPWKSDPRKTWTDDRTFPAEILVVALEACAVGGSTGWREVREELRSRRPFPADAVLTVHRVRDL